MVAAIIVWLLIAVAASSATDNQAVTNEKTNQTTLDNHNKPATSLLPPISNVAQAHKDGSDVVISEIVTTSGKSDNGNFTSSKSDNSIAPAPALDVVDVTGSAPTREITNKTAHNAGDSSAGQVMTTFQADNDDNNNNNNDDNKEDDDSSKRENSTISRRRTMATGENQDDIQVQRQYSNSRLLLRFVVITLFVLLSLSLITVYTIKFCLCHRNTSSSWSRQHHSASRRPKRGPSLASSAGSRNLLQGIAFNGLRRCNLIADASSEQQHHSNNQSSALVDQILPLPLSLPAALQQHQQQQQPAQLQCSCFHPDNYSAQAATDNFVQQQQQRDCVWWCNSSSGSNLSPSLSSFGDGPFSGLLPQPTSLINYEQQTASGRQPDDSPHQQQQQHQQPPPAYSDIYTPQGIDGSSRQKNLLVKLNLNKTRVLSPDELNLLSRLIDVPIVVQHRHELDPAAFAIDHQTNATTMNDRASTIQEEQEGEEVGEDVDGCEEANH